MLNQIKYISIFINGCGLGVGGTSSNASLLLVDAHNLLWDRNTVWLYHDLNKLGIVHVGIGSGRRHSKLLLHCSNLLLHFLHCCHLLLHH